MTVGVLIVVDDDCACASCGEPFPSTLPRGSLRAAAVYCVRCRIRPRNVRVAQEVADLIGPSRWRGMVVVKEESSR